MERIHRYNPNTKLIAVLRNPVDKSYSHYYQSEKYGEKRTFEEVVRQEIDDISRWNSELKDDNYFATKVENSILARGFYAEQLITWLKIFSKDQIMIIQSEKLASNTEDVMNDVFEFLELPKFNIPNTKKVNVSKYEKMNPHRVELHRVVSRCIAYGRTNPHHIA